MKKKDDCRISLLLITDEKCRLEKEVKQISEKNIELEQRFMKWDESLYYREKHMKETLDSESRFKHKELKNDMIKLKEIHAKEKELLEQASQRNIELIKSSFEQEKILLYGKMDALKEEIEILNKNNSKSNSIYEELKGKINEEVLGIKKQKDELIQKLEISMHNNQQFKIQIRENEQNFENRVKIYKEDKVLSQEEIKRLKQIIVDFQ